MQRRGRQLHVGRDALETGADSQVGVSGLRRIRDCSALAAVAASAAAIAACGSDGPSDPGSSAVGSPGVETTARESDCIDWNAATVEEQQVIVDSISEYESGAPSGTIGRHMPDEQAYEVFNRFCERESSRSFKLYKLYVRAAAFTEPQ